MKNEPGGTQPAATSPDYKPHLLKLLGLSDDATDEQIAQVIELTKLDDYKIPHEAKGPLVNILLSDREKGEALLAAFPRIAPPGDLGEPPRPTHISPRYAHAKSPEQKVAAGNKLIAEVQAEGKYKDYTSARNEARRRNPVLFE